MRLPPHIKQADVHMARSIEEDFGTTIDAFLAWWASETAHLSREPADLRPVLETALLRNVRDRLIDLLAAAYREGLGC
jgi:hypothetical protein